MSIPPEFLRLEAPERNGRAALPGEVPWPQLDEAALCGLAGDVVREIMPHSEADPVALLANVLVVAGNAMGRGAHMPIAASHHYLNLMAGIVGATSKGRKGSSLNPILEVIRDVDPVHVDERVMGGLSSGEGLIYAVRDRQVSEDHDGNTTVVDPGAADKRLMVVEGELAGPLGVIIRQAYDGGKLATLTRNSPLKATNAHISIIGHITRTELLKQLTETDAYNGFANRFLWLMVRRSKALPFGGEWHKVDSKPLVRRLSSTLAYGREHRQVGWEKGAARLWEEEYEGLSEGKVGLVGAVTSRAEAHVVRLAALYATLDRQPVIARTHLEAALALWRYAEASARYIFGDATGDTIADKLLAALEGVPDGLTRTELSNLLGRHQSRDRIDGALALLVQLGRVRQERVGTMGRTAERWFVT